jgi:hypothetical protein
MVLAMGARTRRFTGLASGSGKATAVVVCAVMLLAGCGGSGDSAIEEGAPVVRGDVAATGSESTSTIPSQSAESGTVTFNGAGGERDGKGDGPEKFVAYQEGFSGTALTLNPFTRTSRVDGKLTPWKFEGWATSPGGSVKYVDGASHPFTTDRKLYARWAPTVKFWVTDDQPSDVEQTSLTATALTLNTFTRPPDVFLGWRSEPGDLQSGPDYADGAVYSFNEPDNLYAVWGTAVTFDANGGTGTMPTQKIQMIADLEMNRFTRIGYSFDGWASTPTGVRAWVDGESWSSGSYSTLYARWVCLPLSVTASGDRVSADRAEVNFSASSSASPWTSFTATATDGGQTATISQSANSGKITVSGLRKHTGYRFTVTATNAGKCSYTSGTTNRVEQWRK